MFEYIKTLISNNEFASGGLLVVFSSSLMYVLRNIPIKIYNFIKYRTLITYEFNNRDDFYFHINNWIYTLKNNWKNNKIVTSDYSNRCCAGNMFGDNMKYVAGYGKHILKYGKFNYMLIDKVQEKKEGIIDSIESIFITFPFWIKSRIDEDIKKVYKENSFKNRHSVYMWTNTGGFDNIKNIQFRSINTVITKHSNLVLREINKFINSKDFYLERGIPYRRGYLLYGPPGNGKSSFVLSIANELKKDIFIINLGDKNLNDLMLHNMFRYISPDSIILLEDIDCVFNKRNNSKNDVTMSALLNVIDGISTRPSGSILFMTTNHIENLDEALIRHGRVDKKLLFDNADKEQAHKMLKLYKIPYNNEWIEWAEGRPMAELQDSLMTNNTEENIKYVEQTIKFL